MALRNHGNHTRGKEVVMRRKREVLQTGPGSKEKLALAIFTDKSATVVEDSLAISISSKKRCTARTTGLGRDTKRALVQVGQLCTI
jgi:hypothetical protein